MVYLSKKDKETIIKELSKTNNKRTFGIVNKLKFPKKIVYAKGESEIRNLLYKAFNENKRAKIKYYGPQSDEFTNRVIEIYQIGINFIIAI